VAIPRGYKLRPVEAAQAWLAAAEISSGPVFRAMALSGKVSDQRLADDSASRIVEAVRGPGRTRGVAARSLDTLRGYVRRVDLFREHAGAAFL
jgi:hypothetical protein